MTDFRARIDEQREYPINSNGGFQNLVRKPYNWQRKFPSNSKHTENGISPIPKSRTHLSPPLLISDPSRAPHPSLLDRLDPVRTAGGTSCGAGRVPSLMDRISSGKTLNSPAYGTNAEQTLSLSITMETPVELCSQSSNHSPSVSECQSFLFSAPSEHINGYDQLPHLNETTRTRISLPQIASPSQSLKRIAPAREGHLPISDRPILLSSTGEKRQRSRSEANININRRVGVADGPRSPCPTSASQVRNALLPLVMQNAQRRSGLSAIGATEVRGSVGEALTDEFCESFVDKFQLVEKQMQDRGKIQDISGSDEHENSRPSDNSTNPENQESGLHGQSSNQHASGSSQSMLEPCRTAHPNPSLSLLVNPPTAPKAMRLQGSYQPIKLRHSLPSRPLSRPGKEIVSECGLTEDKLPVVEKQQIYSKYTRHEDAASGDPNSSYSNAGGESSNKNGISIPTGPKFFNSPLILNAKERRNSAIAYGVHSPPFASHLVADGRRSRSPVEYCSRSPSFDGYAHSLPPRQGSRSFSRSNSTPNPKYDGRETSYTQMNRHPKDSPRSQTRNDGFTRPSYKSRSRSPLRLPPSPADCEPHRRISDYLPQDEQRRGFHHQTSLSRSPSRQRSASGSPKPIPLNRRNEQDPKQLNSSTDQTSIISSPHPQSRSGVRKSVSSPDENLQAEPLPELPLLLRSPNDLVRPSRDVPGIWSVAEGVEGIRIVEIELEITNQTSLKWNLPNKSSLISPQIHLKPSLISLRLFCLSADVVRSTYENSKLEATSSEGITSQITQLKSSWPEKGTLTIVVNPGQVWERTFLPIDLDTDRPPLVLSGCIYTGKNVIRLIQLADMSEKAFVLCALPVGYHKRHEPPWDLPSHFDGSSELFKMEPAVVEVLTE